MAIDLGATVSDTLTNAKGTVVGRSTYLTAAPRIQVQPATIDDNGQPHEPYWIDEARLRPDEGPKAQCGFVYVGGDPC